MNARSAAIHMPRPGSFALMSGTTVRDGPSTKRTSRASGKTSPVAMQRLSREPLIETASVAQTESGVCRLLSRCGRFRHDVFSLYPSRLYTGLHDDAVHLIRGH